jgi:hypothetical protein
MLFGLGVSSLVSFQLATGVSFDVLIGRRVVGGILLRAE